MLLVVSSLAGFLAMALYAIFAPLGMLDIRAPRGNSQYIVIACAAGALVGVFTLRQIVAQRGSSRLRLTVAGLETGNTMTTVRHSWDEVADIADRPINGRHATGAAYIVTADGRVRAHPTDWYTPGGQVLRELMRFYWRHPERRSELVDGTALKRLQVESRDH